LAVFLMKIVEQKVAQPPHHQHVIMPLPPPSAPFVVVILAFLHIGHKRMHDSVLAAYLPRFDWSSWVSAHTGGWCV
jgi:hypothetical protein